MEEQTAGKVVGAWFIFCGLLSLGALGLMTWGAIEMILWIGRH